MSNDIRVRFAPSPTGYLHVGSLRTALYNYLYAKKVGGKFILRIEDTDRNRYVEDAVDNLMKTMKMVGLNYDEGPEIGGDYGPYFQSERTALYKKYADELIAIGAAYRCFCTPEELDQMRQEQIANKEDTRYNGHCRNLSDTEIAEKLARGDQFVVRLKVPKEGEITFYDVVRDKVTFPWDMVDDQVLIKSDGHPTYHLANVVDDHHMKISHVIRGEEWLSSVPKHLFMYQQLGWKPPKLAHLPLLLNADKSKLSKRQGDVAVEDFINNGFLPETLLNFVALLGWHDKSDKEFFTLQELEKAFSLKRITKSGAVFDRTKLNWMNGHYIKNLPLKVIIEKVKPFFESLDWDLGDEKNFANLINFARERVSLLSEFPDVIKPFFTDLEFNEESEEILKKESSIKVIGYWIKTLKTEKDWNDQKIAELVNNSGNELSIKGKDLYFPLRLALFGECHGPDLGIIYSILGHDKAIKRLENSYRG